MIENMEIVEEYFGFVLGFHDSEIENVNMDKQGPSIEITIKLTEALEEIDNEGHYKQGKSCHINLLFQNIIEMKLADFGSQNILFDLTTEKKKNGILTILDSSCGLNGYILCSKVSVANLTQIK